MDSTWARSISKLTSIRSRGNSLKRYAHTEVDFGLPPEGHQRKHSKIDRSTEIIDWSLLGQNAPLNFPVPTVKRPSGLSSNSS